MNVHITEDYKALSRRAAELVARYIRENPGALLCLAAGNTPLGMFKELIHMQAAGSVDFSHAYWAGLDEWVGLGFHDKGSCSQVMFDSFYTPANIPERNIRLFDGLDPDTSGQCRAMERWIRKRGGIGLTVLGIGMNGHIGFNEPGAPDAEGCFVVALDDVTRSVSKKYFGKPRPVEQGITIGWHALKAARQVVLIADGEGKAPIVKAALRGPIDPSVPASLMQDHPALSVVIDKAAASLL